MDLCKCEGTHTIRELGHWDGCALVGQGHTAFTISQCVDCGKLCGFPDENLQIALEKGMLETKAFLRGFDEGFIAARKIYAGD